MNKYYKYKINLMKNVFFLFSLIIYISSTEFTLKAGTKTEGYCKQGDFIFTYENSFYLNNKYPKEDYNFNLLMEKNIISICEIKKRNLSIEFEIICKIKKYEGCNLFFPFKIPKLRNIEPEKKKLKNGDIIFFVGFKERGIFQKSNNIKKNNKFGANNLILNAGAIIKNMKKKDKQFFIINNIFSERTKKIYLENASFEIKVRVDNDENKEIESNCTFDCVDGNSEYVEKVNITCTFDNDEELISIYIVNDPNKYSSEDITIEFNGFKDIAFYTVILGKLEKGSFDEKENKYYFSLKNTSISEPLKEKKNIDLYFIFNKEEKRSRCIFDKKKFFDMICFIKDSSFNNYEIVYNKGDYFNYELIENLTFYLRTDGNISTRTLSPGYIIKEGCTNNGIYSFLFGGNKLMGDASVIIKGEFYLELYNFTNEVKCEIITNIYHTIKCRFEPEEKEKVYFCNSYKDIMVNKLKNLINDKYILLEGGNILYLEGFENLQSFSVEGGNLLKGACKINKYTFNISESEIYNRNLSVTEINFFLNLVNIDNTANCTFIFNDRNITCDIVGNEACPIIDDKNDLKIEKNPNDLILEANKRIKFYNFEGKSTIVTISAGKLEYDYYEAEKKIQLIFSNSSIDYNITKNIDFNIIFELNEKENKTTKCNFDIKTNKITCYKVAVENNKINLIILKEPKDNYEFLEEKTIIFKGFQIQKINTLIAGKIKKGKCEENSNTYLFSFENSTIPISLSKKTNFVLQMKEPGLTILCSLPKINITEQKIANITCEITGTSQCPYLEDENYNLIVDKYEPKFIQVNESALYFSSFSNQSTINYTISVYNIINDTIDNCKCYFNLANKVEPQYLIEDIKFSFNISLKNIQYISKCILFNNININNGNEDNSTIISCFFDLKPDICNSDDILIYNLKIGENFDKTIQLMNNYQNVVFKGFINKETVNIYILNITEKIKKDDIFIFKLKYNDYGENITIDNTTFEMNYNGIGLSNCYFVENDKYLKCISHDQSLKNETDISIDTWPNYIILNNQTIYFNNKEGLKTYSVIAGKIRKVNCKEQTYQFNLIANNMPNDIPKGQTFSIDAKLTNTNDIDNDNESKKANCSIGDNKIICKVNVNNCSSVLDIILNDISPVPENSIFYYGFNNRRTYTIKAGKINKGNCYLLSDNSLQYTFSFTNNIITYEKDARFNITLSTKIVPIILTVILMAYAI